MNKFLIFFLLFFIYNVNAQSKEDFKSIIDLTITKYDQDSISINENFGNKPLIYEFKRSNDKIYELVNISFKTRQAKRLLKRNRNNNISKFTDKISLHNNKLSATISSPVFSIDKSKAIIYIAQFLGQFTGNGSYIIFHKIGNNWELIENEASSSWSARAF